MKKKFIWWSLIIVWCGFIFFQSNQPGEISNIQSNMFVDLASKILAPLTGPGSAGKLSFFVRKAAHFTEYFILGLLLFRGFYNAEKLKKLFVTSFFAGVLYAISDEIHQYFVPGREMKAFDVFIDSLGVISALSLSLIFNKKRSVNKDM